MVVGAAYKGVIPRYKTLNMWYSEEKYREKTNYKYCWKLSLIRPILINSFNDIRLGNRAHSPEPLCETGARCGASFINVFGGEPRTATVFSTVERR